MVFSLSWYSLWLNFLTGLSSRFYGVCFDVNIFYIKCFLLFSTQSEFYLYIFLLIFVHFSAVRYGRVPKRSRERLEEQQQRVVSSGQQQQQQQLETEQLESSRELALYDLTLTIAQAHHSHCAYTEMRTRGLVRKPAIFVSPLTTQPVQCSQDGSIPCDRSVYRSRNRSR